MYCKEKTSFCPEAPKYHRLLIDLLSRAHKNAAQLKVKDEEIDEAPNLPVEGHVPSELHNMIKMQVQVNESSD